MARKINHDNNEDVKQNGRTARSVKKDTWLHQLKRLPLLLLIPLGLLLPKLVQKSPEKVEHIYSRTIYPVIARIVGFLSSLVPFSLAELIIIGLGAALILILIIRLLRIPFGKLKNRRRNRIRFFSFLISLGIFAGVMLNLFYGMWAFNHYRQPVSKLMDLTVRQYSTEELASVCERLAQEAAELRSQVAEDERGVFTIGDKSLALRSVKTAYETLGKQNELFSNKCYTAKTVLFSETLSKLDIAGIYIPFTEEANVNVNQPDLYVLSGAAHETAHYFGFAREDEANFLSYYVSLFSSDAALRYSSTMMALTNCSTKLYSYDKERYSQLYALYTDGMQRDLADYREYYVKYENHPAGKVNDTINDAYLQYNGHDDGIRSYGRMIDLLLAFYLPKSN